MVHTGLYQCQYRSVNYKPSIYLFYRNEDKTKNVVRIDNFKPYFYIDNELKGKVVDKVISSNSVSIPTIFNKKVTKCYVNKPSDIYNIREIIGHKNLHEADILFDLRYMIDKIDEVTPTEYRIITIDIETDCLHGFPDNENPIEPISCLSLYDNYTDKNISFAWREDLEQSIKGETFYFNNEKTMLRSFLNYWHSLNADIVTGWNLGFDMGYLLARLQELEIPNYKLSNIHDDIFNGTVTKKPKGEIEIVGMVLFDGLQAYKKMHHGELTSYSLNNVAHEELDEEKDKVYNTGDVWREDIDKLINYNRKDVKLTWKIIEKAKLISIFDAIKCFSGVRNLNDCFLSSRIHETRIMKKYKDKFIFPTKRPFEEKSDKTRILGGFVKEPKPGLYENIIVLDFKSLYPSLIYTFNLSTEMVDKNGLDIGNGVKIRQEPKGIMPTMIKDLIQLKDDMKKQVEGTGQNISDKMFAIKGFINSFYGVNALTSFRLYNKDIAESITYLGRFFVNELSNFLEKLGYKVVYNDTDSMFVQIKDIKEIEPIIKKVNAEVQNILSKNFRLSDSNISVEFEKMFSRIILQTKKRYAGLVTYKEKDGKLVETNEIKIVGMAARRSDVSEISKQLQRNMFKFILEGGSEEDVVKYVKYIINKILKDEIDLEDLAIPTKLNKDIIEYDNQNIPKIRGVKWSNKNLKTQFRSGQKFSLIYVNHPETDCVCFEDVDQIKNIEIDKSAMIEKAIILKITEVFLALGWDKNLKHIETYVNNKLTNQTELSNFLNS